MKSDICNRIGPVLLVGLLMLANAATAYQGDGIVESGENESEELRRAAQNPMADLMSLPFQNNTNFRFGPLEKTQNVTNIQPVIPFHLNDDGC